MLPAAAQRYRPASYASYLLSASATAFLTADVAAIALSQNVLRSCFTVERNDVVTNGRLNRNVKLLTRDEIFHLLNQLTTTVRCVIVVGDQREASTRSPLISTSTRTMFEARKRLKL